MTSARTGRAMTTAKETRTESAPKLSLGFGRRIGASFELGGDLFGMLLVTLENFQPSGQEVFELLIAGRWNECVLQRAIHGLMVGDLVVDVGLVEGRAVELGKFGALVACLLTQLPARVILFRLDVKLLR